MAATANVAHGRRLRLAVACRHDGQSPCAGLLKLRLGRRTIAARRFWVAAGGQRTLSVRVRRRHWWRVRNRRRVKLQAVAVLTPQAGAADSASRTVSVR